MSDDQKKIEQLNAQVAALSFAIGIAMGTLRVIQVSGHSSAAEGALDAITDLVHPIFYSSVTIPLPKERT